MGQVATAVGWSDKDSKVTCRPRKIGLPVLDREECLGTAPSPHVLTIDKGCIGVIGSPSMICKVCLKKYESSNSNANTNLFLGRCR